MQEENVDDNDKNIETPEKNNNTDPTPAEAEAEGEAIQNEDEIEDIAGAATVIL